MHSEIFKFKAQLTKWSNVKGSWYFVSVPKSISEDINILFGDLKKGWGSLPINARIGNSIWKTSIFPDKKTGSYLLPVKADIRNKENLADGDEVLLQITLSR